MTTEQPKTEPSGQPAMTPEVRQFLCRLQNQFEACGQLDANMRLPGATQSTQDAHAAATQVLVNLVVDEVSLWNRYAHILSAAVHALAPVAPAMSDPVAAADLAHALKIATLVLRPQKEPA